MSNESSDTKVRLLTHSEKEELRRDIAESSAWAKKELQRRRCKKEVKSKD